VVVVVVVAVEAVAARVVRGTWSRQARIIAKLGIGWYWLRYVSVRMVHELPQAICLVLSKRKLADVALYSPACSRCCRKKRPTPDYYCGKVLESRGIGAGSSPIGCEGFVKASKVQSSSLITTFKC